MKVNCPECLAEHHVADDTIPDAGMSLRCRICGTRFRVAKDSPEAADNTARIMDGGIGDDEMVCPKCFITQKKSDTCICCGLAMPGDSAAVSGGGHAQQQAGADAAEADGMVAPARSEDEPRQEPARYTMAELFRGLFDLSFNHLITPGMIKAIYGFVLIFGGAFALILLNFFVFAAGNYAAAAVTLAGYLAAIVIVRIQAEFLIIFFRIERQTRKTDG